MGLTCCGCTDRSRNVHILFNEDRSRSKEILKRLLLAASEKNENTLEEDGNNMELVFPKVRRLDKYYSNLKGKLDYKKYKTTFKYNIQGIIRGVRHIYTTDVILLLKHNRNITLH